MIILPAVDIFKRKAVRLERGEEDKVILEKDDPYELSKFWYKEGAKGLHLIDLQGAIKDDYSNMDLIEKIIKDIPIPIEVGGGIRSYEKIEKILSFGAWRVIISSLLKEDVEFLRRLREDFKERVIPSIDWKEGYIGIKGWKETISWNEVKNKLEEAGFNEIIFTDILKDGTLKGVDEKLLSFILENTKFNLWIAGGISSKEDLLTIKSLNEKFGRIKGVIIGRALLEGKMTLKEAEKLLC